MGSKNSEPKNKVVNEKKLFKCGLGFGKGEVKIEENFQMDFTRKTNKKYTYMDCKDTKRSEVNEVNEI